MKILLNFRILVLICLAMSIAILPSCNKDDFDSALTKVELLSFGPTGVQHGEKITLVGNNLTQVTEVDLVGAAIPKANFVSQTDENIVLVIPNAAQEGFITLKTPDGDIVSKTKLNFTIPVTVKTMTATARPGDNITLTGDYLDWVREVKFANDLPVTTFVSQSINQLVVKVPTNAQTGKLTITYVGYKPGSFDTDSTLKVTLPVTTSMAPNPVLHAANLTITGTNLDLTKSIIFSGVTTPVTTFVSQSATQIVVKVPGGTTKGKLTLVAASGVTSVSTADLDVVLPAVTTMAPNPVDPETNLTITGTNLNLVASIAFQNAAPVTTFVSQSATQIVVKVPKGVTEGKITLAVLNSTLTVQSPDILKITGAVPPPIIALPFYLDAVTSNWNGWTGGGWGGTANYANTTPVREGVNSIKIDYVGGWGSPLQLGGASVNKGSYTTFKISLYGAPGSGGKTVQLVLNGGAGSQSITIVEGKWTDYSFPISSFISGSTITEIWLQETTGNGGFTVYVDDMGLN